MGPKANAGVLTSEGGNFGQPRDLIQTTEKVSVDEKILPFVMRGFRAPEIVCIAETVFDKQEIWRAFFRQDRPEWHKIPADNAGIRKASLWVNEEDKDRDEKKSMDFVRALWRRGLIPENLSTRDELFELFKSQNRQLPDNKIDLLLLEIYLSVNKKPENKRKSKLSDLSLYNDLGNMIGGIVWYDTKLAPERYFINKVMRNRSKAMTNVDSADEYYYSPTEVAKRERIRKMVDEEAEKKGYKKQHGLMKIF